MATVKAENDDQPGFDVETFGKIVALFDSDKAGEAENAFRKSVLMCAKNGLRFVDAAAQAFGSGGGEAEKLRDQLQEEQAQHLADVEAAAAKVRELNDQVAALSGDNGGGGDEHVIDLSGRLRRAWRFPQFRLLVLTVMIAVAAVAKLGFVPIMVFVLPLFLAWSVAQFRKKGFGQMLMKYVVYLLTVLVCGAVGQGFGVTIGDGPIGLVVLLLAMVLTFSKLSEWLCERVRVQVWESDPVHVVRAWF